MSDEKIQGGKKPETTATPAPEAPTAGAQTAEPPKMPEGVSSITSYLDEKRRIEEEKRRMDEDFKKKFMRKLTVMFTDIKGSTAFFEANGDLEGRAMVEEHNQLLFPVVEEFGGTIIKTIGDAIMAKYPEPAAGVRAALKMQAVLAEHNARQKAGDTSARYNHSVRIGVNYGEGIEEASDVFGDVVNCAARVESLADGGQILISEDLYREVKDLDDVTVRFQDTTPVKGKSEPIRVYRVIWDESELVQEEEELMRTGTRKVASVQRARNEEVLEISLSREGETIKISAGEKLPGTERTVSQYEEVKITPADLTASCNEITTLLNRANKRGKLSKEILKKLKEVGQHLYDQLFPADVKQQIENTKAETLMLRLDDRLVQIPWELIYDGKEFLGLRFAIGRIVATRQKVAGAKPRRLGSPLKMLVMADPRGDLAASSEEGQILRGELDKNIDALNVHLKAGAINRTFVQEKVRNYDILHYAGHADYDANSPSDSGWLMADGKVTAGDIMKMAGGKPMPALVFSNACQSGQTEEWTIEENYEQEIYGLANAFLLSGVQHYVGTFWDILDTPSQHFSSAFYKALIEGESVGEAIRLARHALVERYGEENIVWASYMLYGDPTFHYHTVQGGQVVGMPTADDFSEDETDEPAKAAANDIPGGSLRGGAAASAAPPMGGTHAPSTVMVETKSGNSMAIGAIIAILAIIAAGALFFIFGSGPGSKADDASVASGAYAALDSGDLGAAQSEFQALVDGGDHVAKGYEGLAAVALQKNDVQSARNYAREALNADSGAVYPHVVLGTLAMNSGDNQAALSEFQIATQQPNGEVWQKSEAYNRLGRLYAAAGDNQQALGAYQQATTTDPQNATAFSNMGVLQKRMGNTEAAVAALEKSATLNPQDAVATRLLASAKDVAAVSANKTRQEMISDQVARLKEQYNQGQALSGQKPASGDDWTSRPLNVAFIDFNSKGTSIRDGEDEFLLMEIINQSQEQGRVQVVEREMLDELLGELNLASSDLADKETALKLGRLVGASMISTGSLIRHEGEVSISLRMIETETSRIPVAVTKVFEDNPNIVEIAQTVAGEMVDKLRTNFPLRGLVVEPQGDTVTLNVGTKQGVTPGVVFEVLAEKEVKSGGRVLGTTKTAVAKLEVTQVEDGFSIAKVLEGGDKIQAGMKVAQK